MAPWISGSVTTSRAERAAVVARSSRAVAGASGVEPHREGVGAEHPEPTDRIAPADQHRLAAAAGQRSLGDADDAQRQDGAVDPGDVHDLVERDAEARGQRLRDDRGAAFVQGRSAASRSPAMNRRRPSSARSAPDTAAPSVRLAPTAISKVAISVTRATPGDWAELGGDLLVRSDRAGWTWRRRRPG